MGKDEGLKIVRRTRYALLFGWSGSEKKGRGRRKGVFTRRAGRAVGQNCKLDVI